MADAPKDAPEVGRTLIHNIGLLLTGDLDQPIADNDCLLIEDGVIIGLEQGDADRVIDAGGCAVAPGLIDGHCHPVFGDWTPRQNQSGWIEMNVNGGVTSFISAGEVHLPGRPGCGRCQSPCDGRSALLCQFPLAWRKGHRGRARARAGFWP